MTEEEVPSEAAFCRFETGGLLVFGHRAEIREAVETLLTRATHDA